VRALLLTIAMYFAVPVVYGDEFPGWSTAAKEATIKLEKLLDRVPRNATGNVTINTNTGIVQSLDTNFSGTTTVTDSIVIYAGTTTFAAGTNNFSGTHVYFLNLVSFSGATNVSGSSLITFYQSTVTFSAATTFSGSGVVTFLQTTTTFSAQTDFTLSAKLNLTSAVLQVAAGSKVAFTPTTSTASLIMASSVLELGGGAQAELSSGTISSSTVNGTGTTTLSIPLAVLESTANVWQVPLSISNNGNKNHRATPQGGTVVLCGGEHGDITVTSTAGLTIKTNCKSSGGIVPYAATAQNVILQPGGILVFDGITPNSLPLSATSLTLDNSSNVEAQLSFQDGNFDVDLFTSLKSSGSCPTNGFASSVSSCTPGHDCQVVAQELSANCKLVYTQYRKGSVSPSPSSDGGGSDSGSGSNAGLYALLVLLLIPICLICLFFYWRRKKKKRGMDHSTPEPEPEPEEHIYPEVTVSTTPRSTYYDSRRRNTTPTSPLTPTEAVAVDTAVFEPQNEPTHQAPSTAVTPPTHNHLPHLHASPTTGMASRISIPDSRRSYISSNSLVSQSSLRNHAGLVVPPPPPIEATLMMSRVSNANPDTVTILGPQR